MTVLYLLENIDIDQIALILRERQAMPEPDYFNACLRARIAAASNRKPTWSIYSMAYINALLQGIRRVKYSQSYDIIKLMSVVECFAFAMIGQGALSFEDFNLAIGPLAAVLAPELFADEQTWTKEPLVKVEYSKPYRPESYRFRKTRKKLEEMDLVSLVDQLAKDAGKQAPQPVRVEPVNQESTFEAMLEKIKKP